MARPRKTEGVSPAAEREIAPETVATVPVAPAPVYRAPQQMQPRQMRIERAGAKSEPYTRRFPQVRGGICEYCGVKDSNTPSQFQYKLCEHYRGKQLRCSYCPENKDPDDVIYHSKLEIMESPFEPGTIITVCSATECEKKHQERFKLAI